MTWLNFFLSAHCLVAAGALLGWGLRALGRLRPMPLRARDELRIHYALLALLGLLLLVPAPARESFSFHPVAHVELSGAAPRTAAPAAAVLRLPGASPRSSGFPLGACGWGALFLALAGLTAVAWDYLRLAALLRRATVFRRVGRVRIAVAEGIPSPLSTRVPGAAWVVLPPRFLTDALDLRVAVAHELQHHRAGDTAWCHALAPLRALCFFHPLRVLWAAVLAEAQELACDEVLVEQKRRVGAGDYSRCLIRAAESAAREGDGRAYAAALGFSSARRLLARRIESMYVIKRNNRWVAPVLGLLAGTALATGAWASGSWVVDSRVSGRRMAEMAETARRGTDFPVTVNDLVLRELNRYLGTEKGREFVASAFENLDRLRPLLDRQLAEHRVPEELLAVGLIESGFQNLPQSNHPSHAAGIWQFIPGTARIFGLRVDAGADERLDVERETDAAFRYLAANQLRYGDWLLGVMAYNMGERALDAAIREAGTRDPWKLIRMGYGNDDGYLARFMAGVLILKNRSASR